MDMLTENATLVTILATEGNFKYFRVPEYQREYTWGKTEWAQLLDDITGNDKGYFVGSIISINDNNVQGLKQPTVFKIVDGQQRLTTLSILLMSIYKKLKDVKKESLSEDEIERYQVSLSNIKSRLVYRTDDVNDCDSDEYFEDESDKNKYCRLRLRPSTQGRNYSDYLHILEKLELIKGDFRSKNSGNRRLRKAQDYFVKNIPEGYGDLIDILDKVSGLKFIHISVPSSFDAFVLFESLNNRGIPLSAMDIIKNKILARLKHFHGMSIKAAYSKWQKLLKDLPEYRDQERFLRQYHNAFSKIEKEHTRATKSTLIKIYERRIKKDALSTIGDLADKAKIYNTFIVPESNELENRKRYFLDLNRIGSASSYLFLLYLYSLPSGKIEDREKTIDETLRFFIKYYVRRNITDIPNTRDLDTINMRIIERCDDHIKRDGKIDGEFIIKNFTDNKGYISGINEFKEALKDNLYDSNVDMVRFLLTKLDEKHHSRENKPNLWERNSSGRYVWTIEHIFPQAENITQPWAKMIANGDMEKAREIHENYVHCLGNLTLSGYNSNLSNMEFKDKQNRQSTSDKRIGYKNGLALNNLPFSVNGKETNLAMIDKWTEESIKARNDKIVDSLLEMFALESEM